MKLLTRIVCLAGALLLGTGLFAQNRVSAVLIDESNGEPVGFATVSLTLDGAKKPSKYVLSEADGKVEISGVRAGSYTFKAELLGYLPYEKQIKVPDVKDLGEIRMKVDTQQLDAASVSAAGNPIIIKKDTIEYNASSFKTTENDVLEDLLKKLPGIEVSEDGSITHNGQTIKKITIDGKTFFLDDPQLASKNIPAKIINKLKVVDKKSDQAEFTGIDDGEEETIIDLSIKPGMMKGTFGNVMAGGGHDLPSTNKEGDWRYQGAAFVGKFTDKTCAAPISYTARFLKDGRIASSNIATDYIETNSITRKEIPLRIFGTGINWRMHSGSVKVEGEKIVGFNEDGTRKTQKIVIADVTLETSGTATKCPYIPADVDLRTVTVSFDYTGTGKTGFSPDANCFNISTTKNGENIDRVDIEIEGTGQVIGYKVEGYVWINKDVDINTGGRHSSSGNKAPDFYIKDK